MFVDWAGIAGRPRGEQHEEKGAQGAAVMSKPKEVHLHRKQKNDRHGTKVTLALARARASCRSLSHSLSHAHSLLSLLAQVRMRQPLLFDAELKDARCSCACCALARQTGAVAQRC